MYQPLLRIVALLLVLATIGAGLLAGYLWIQGDRTGSLASATVMATFALAAVALLTLRQNERLVQQNAELVRAASEEATATRDQAGASKDQATASRETVEEMRREREWAYKPLLVVIRRPIKGSELTLSQYVVQNIGTGPALNVRLAAHRFAGDPAGHTWLSAETPGIAPGGEDAFGTWNYGGDAEPGQPRPDRYRCIVDEWQASEGEEVVAVRYDDWFGTHYRSGGPSNHPTEEYRGHQTTIDAPDWVRCS